MTPDELAWRQGIIDHPGDDVRRGALADWLEEHGQPERAEFIRVQCELTRMPPVDSGEPCRCRGRGYFRRTDIPGVYNDEPGNTFPCPWCPLRRREAELWQASRLNGAPHPWFGDGGKIAGVRPNALHLSHADTPTITVAFGGHEIELTLVRGQIGHVRGPLAAFWEERECGRCRNKSERTGWVRVADKLFRCLDCDGTGRTSGVTPAFRELCRREPIEAVGVTDRRPIHAPGIVGNPPWRWLTDDGSGTGATVPEPVFLAMPTGAAGVPESEYWGRFFPTEAAAVAALSDALIALARA